MKIENIVALENLPSSKNSVEVSPDDFNKNLSMAINDKASKSKSDSLGQEPKDNSEDQELLNILGGLFALPIQENQIQNNIQLVLGEDLLPPSLDNVQALDEVTVSELMINLQTYPDTENQPMNLFEETDFDFKTLDIESSDIIPEEIEYLSGHGIGLGEGPKNQEEALADKIIDNPIRNTMSEIGVKSEFSEIISEKPVESMESIPVKETESELEPVKKLDNNSPTSITNIFDTEISKDFEVFTSEAQPLKVVLSEENINNINETIMHLAESTTEGETSILKVKLYPEDLGTVDVTVSMESGKITAKILVDSEHVRGLFANSVNELREVLVKENINIEKINIDLNLNSDFSKNSFSNNSGFNMNQHGAFHNNNRNYNFRSYKGLYNSSSNEVMINEPKDNISGAISILA